MAAADTPLEVDETTLGWYGGRRRLAGAGGKGIVCWILLAPRLGICGRGRGVGRQ